MRMRNKTVSFIQLTQNPHNKTKESPNTYPKHKPTSPYLTSQTPIPPPNLNPKLTPTAANNSKHSTVGPTRS